MLSAVEAVHHLFVSHLGRSETITDFMKWFRAALLHLDSVSPDTTLQAIKQAIHPSIQFYGSLSIQPPTSIDELFQLGNQYAMLEDDVVAVTKRTVTSTSNGRGGSGGKGKGNRSRRHRDVELE